MSELKGKLVSIEYQKKVSWVKTLLDTFAENEDGSITIPVDNVNVWKEFIETAYKTPGEGESCSYADEVDKYWPLIEALQSPNYVVKNEEASGSATTNEGTKPEVEPKGWTREKLMEVKRVRGFPGLRDIGVTLGVKSTSTEGIINKILNAQDVRKLEPKSVDVEFSCVGIEMLYHKPINYEEGRFGNIPKFPPLVTEQEGEIIIEALEKFGIRWGFTFEFVLKLQSFRCIKNEKHVDWIQLNELCKLYSLPISPIQMTLSKRSYTAPDIRAWRVEA